MQVVFFEDKTCGRLLPVTYTKPVSHLRMGMLTMSERWGKAGFEVLGDVTRPYLQSVFPDKKQDGVLYINARVFPSIDFVKSIQHLKTNETLYSNGQLIATWHREWDSEIEGSDGASIETHSIQ